jgi:Ankyrin repeats (3 copies)
MNNPSSRLQAQWGGYFETLIESYGDDLTEVLQLDPELSRVHKQLQAIEYTVHLPELRRCVAEISTQDANKICSPLLDQLKEACALDETYCYEEMAKNACIRGYAQFLKFLIQRGAILTTPVIDRTIYAVAKAGHLEVLRVFFDHAGEQCNYYLKFYLLAFAAIGGRVEALQFLMDRGADIHVYDDIALRWAAEHGQVNAVVFLLDHGADIHSLDDAALREAVSFGKLEVVRLLLDRGADISTMHDVCICIAARSGSVEMVQLLLDRGALPLVRAAEGGFNEIVQLLLSRGAIWPRGWSR